MLKMSNKFKETDIKNGKYYFFDNMINITMLDPNKIKIDETPYKNILIYHTWYATVENLSSLKINSVNPLYLIINKIGGHKEGSNGNKYLTIVPTNKTKYMLKSMKNY